MSRDLKRCAICNEHFPTHQFNRRRKSTDGLQPHCRECNRIACRAYYLRNPSKHVRDVRANNDQYIARNREVVLAHLFANPCVDCGESDPTVLEFDHVRGEKEGEVPRLAAVPVRHERLVAEIAKCEIRCANCHRRRTGAVQRWWRSGRTASGPAEAGPS